LLQSSYAHGVPGSQMKRQWRECWMRFELQRNKRCTCVKEVHTEAIHGGKCVREGEMKIFHGPSKFECCVCSCT